jgi:hypothetical protein
MTKYIISLFLLTVNFSLHAQSFRELIIHSDLIVKGYTGWSEPKNDYADIFNKFDIKEVIKGETKSREIYYSSYIMREVEMEIEGEKTSEVLFLRKENKHYYLIGYYNYKCVKAIKEILEIIKIPDQGERLSSTLNWFIQILEDETFHDEYVTYTEFDEFSTFYRFYKGKGFFSTRDNIYSTEQKKRILNKLLKIETWDYEECEFAELIYNDFPNQIEQHILKMCTEYFKNNKYHHIYDIEKLLHIIDEGLYSKAIKDLLKKVESNKKETKTNLIKFTIEEIKGIIDSL